MVQISSVFYGLYIWNFSNTYLGDSSLKAHIPILLCPFFSNAIFSYRANAGRGITDSEWRETFRPHWRACGARTLSLLLSFIGRSHLPGPCPQRTNWGQGLFSKADSPFHSHCLSERLTPSRLSGAGFWQPGDRLSGSSCSQPWHSHWQEGLACISSPGPTRWLLPQRWEQVLLLCLHCASFSPVRLFGGLPFGTIHLDRAWQTFYATLGHLGELVFV